MLEGAGTPAQRAIPGSESGQDLHFGSVAVSALISYVRQSGVLTGPVLGVAQTLKAATA